MPLLNLCCTLRSL